VDTLTISLDPAQGAGLVLAIVRVTAFVIASLPFGQILPAAGRLSIALALGMFLAEPYEGSLAPAALLGAGVVNAAVGATLGWFTSVIFQVFFTAGAVLDIISGLFAAVLFDPAMSDRAGVYARLFNMTALALFYVVGGLELLVRGLGFSFDVIALDGGLAVDPAALASSATQLLGRVMVVGLELVLPVAAALFLTEVVLGLASRFSPQTNIFLLGLPAKLLISLTMVSTSLLLFPEAMSGVMDTMERLFGSTLAALAGGQ
jgi:flagellar biosynthesis protein FliR